MIKYFQLIFCFVIINNAKGQSISVHFEDFSINGSMIVENLGGDRRYVHNPERADSGYLPASTFKIFNSLIGLEEKAVSSVNEVLKWDGKKRFYDKWNQDHSMKTAFPVSCVWFYQELAKKIGKETYLDYFGKVNFGNKDPGPEITTFWLSGNLRISANQQISFLKQLYNESLPFSDSVFSTVKEIMVLEKTDDYTLRAKTGWTARMNKQIGWYVGYVENSEDVWFFAMNMDFIKSEDNKYRKKITNKVLKQLKIIN